MASETEIQRVRKAPDLWRGLLNGLLRMADHDLVAEKDVVLLDSLDSKPWLEVLSYRRAEWLLDIRDSVELVTSHHGYGVSRLIQLCYESRFGLDEDEEDWITALKASGRTSVRRNEARRLFAMAKRLGEIETD